MKITIQILFLMLLATLAFGGEDWSSMPLRTLETEAHGGDVEAQLELGRRYDEADGGIDIVDPKLAFRWYRKAARQGLAEAQWRTSKVYATGRGARDSEEEIKWCWAAAQQGHLEARIRLFSRVGINDISESRAEYYDRLGIDLDEQLLFDWCREEAEKGSAEACYILGNHFLAKNKNGIPYRGHSSREPDPEEALIWLKKALEYGCEDASLAQELIGDAYYHQEDFVQAMTWYRTVVTTQYALSQQYGGDKLYEQRYEVHEKIGDLYMEGHGVERDEARALQCYLDATSRSFGFFGGGKAALYRKISHMYKKGIGTAKDRKTAKEWEEKAEKQEDLRGSFDIGISIPSIDY
jgi:TPR repeat protein